MKRSIVRLLSFIRKEIRSFTKDRARMFIFFVMPILVIVTIKFSQNTTNFIYTVGIIDRDDSVGFQFNDPFAYANASTLQSEWDYNSSSNTYLNLTMGQINFTTDTLVGGESMYFRYEFNAISEIHNELLTTGCDVTISNASLTAFTATSLGMILGNDVILAGAISFSYGNITALNGSRIETLPQSVENDSLYHIEMTLFLKNHTYEVLINGTSKGIFKFATNLSTFNTYQSYVYPSMDLFNPINILLDNVRILVNSTPYLDLSTNLTAYIGESLEVIHYTSKDAAHEDLLTRKIGAFLIIPDGFETNLTQDFPVLLNVTTDGTNQYNVPEILKKITEGIIKFREENDFLLDFIVTDVESNFVDNILVGPAWMGLLIPPVLGIAFVASAMITTCESIVDDIPLQRLLLSPLKKTEVIIAKFAAYLFFSVVQILIFLAVWLLALPSIGWNQGFAGSIIDCFILTLSMSTVGITFGFAISAIAKTKAQANQGFVTVFVILLVVWLLRIADIDPFTLGEIGFIGIMFKGLTLADIATEISLLLLYSGVALGTGFVIFSLKKSLV